MAGEWDVSLPIDHTKVSELPQKIRDVRSSAKHVITCEHVVPGDSNSGGQHVKGSARVYLDSTAPATDPEGNALDTSATSDNGRVAVLTGSSNTIKVYVGTSAGVSTGFQAVQVERVKLAETMNANGKVLASVGTGTQSGEAIHVGQLDTTYFKGVSTGVLQVQQIRKYDSGWFAASAANNYAKAHSLGDIPDIVQILVCADTGHSDTVLSGVLAEFSGYYNGTNTYTIDNTNIVVRAGRTNMVTYIDSTNTLKSISEGYMRIRAILVK